MKQATLSKFFGVKDSKDKTNGHDDRKREPDNAALKPAKRESGFVKEDKAATVVEPPTAQDARECKDAMEIDERQNEIDEGTVQKKSISSSLRKRRCLVLDSEDESENAQEEQTKRVAKADTIVPPAKKLKPSSKRDEEEGEGEGREEEEKKKKDEKDKPKAKRQDKKVATKKANGNDFNTGSKRIGNMAADKDNEAEKQEEETEKPEEDTGKEATKKEPTLKEEREKDEENKEAEEEESEEMEEKEKKEVAAKLAMKVDWKPGSDGSMSWKKGEKVPYAALCKTFEPIEAITKRIEILELTTNLFRTVIELTPESLLETLYLCINRLCPDYEGLELGIGESLLIKAIAESTGRSLVQIKADYRDSGDLGTVAKNSRSSQKTLFTAKPLTVPQVFSTLKEIAQITGTSSQTKKVSKIKGLLVACRENEAKYLIRSLEGKLRIGLAEKTVLGALGHAVVLSRPETKQLKKAQIEEELAKAVEVVKSVYNELPCYDLIVPALLKNPIDKLKEICKMTPGIPLKPMLAHPTKQLSEILDRFEGHTFTCEYKYDGERAQIHLLEDGRMMIYSRNSENMSNKYPDIMEKIGTWIKPSTTSFVIDCEAVAWDREKRNILPFQVLSTRKRKDVKEEDITVQVCIFAFDCLYLNGEPLLQKPFATRRQLLHESFQEIEGQFGFARYQDTSNIEDIQTFLETSIQENCEGLMVKMYDGNESSYEPSKRSRNWLKVKKDYLKGIGDSLDLVVVGAFYGRGKRTSVYGAYLLACYDPDREEYQTITKIGTGFSEQALQQHYDFFKDHVIDRPKRYYSFGDGTKPDVWLEPMQVWEVLAADLSISPKYQAAVGHVDPSKGISLRFPRFIRIRDDKKPEEATSSEQVAEFYQRQVNSKEKNSGNVDEGVDNDFDY
ncbi:DNA ligase [Endogone sp. FLAS-F59071]|nr:DNA ligase [Endogone sp. FLAS-F59071]|eukprot:RUS21673.1 DNA ligase [Endogone sp. FLAS-F59071]